ncbi:MAG TPA: SH3 domain-containing protein [Steroidobacteraceae bacterium]|nr:SH3 domain-containing protein [Steroidobacteraceae bacterium]
MTKTIRVLLWVAAGVTLIIGGAVAGPLEQKQGQGGSVVQGGAGTQGSQGANPGLQKCDKPMATIAVAEPQDYVMSSLNGYGLQSPSGLIRMMIQQSNCFIVVERGLAMQNMMQEKQLADQGMLQQGSNVGGGQMKTADFVLTPAVVFSENNAGGVGGALGGLLGHKNSAIGGIVGGLKFKEAQTSMLLADTRSGIQVAAAEGSTKKADLSLGGFVAGGGAAGGIGGYGKTNEGKIIAAALMDNYNNIVTAVRNDPALQRGVGTLQEEAGKVTTAGAVFNEGDVLTPKIANVKLLGSPADGSKVIASLPRGAELIFLGEEKGGFVKVQSPDAEGWVKKILLLRAQ